MTSTEKFCLRWNDFEANISKAFSEIREDKEFFDVTLACDDDQVPAHKVILSACSPFFRTVLKRNKHEHPLLYLKGVKYSELVAVLNFMYHGEVNVAQEDLNAFLAVAEDLKVKGLTQSDSSVSGNGDPTSAVGTGSVAGNNRAIPTRTVKSKSRDMPDALDSPVSSQQSQAPPAKRSRRNSTNNPRLTNEAGHDDSDDIQEVTPVKTEPLATIPTENSSGAMAPAEQYGTELVDAEYTEDYGEYDTGYDADNTYDGSIVDSNATGTDGNKALWLEVKAMMVTTQDVSGVKMYTCTECTYSIRNSTNLRSHIEAKHTTRKYLCEHCNEGKRTWQAFLGHMRNIHGLRGKTNKLN